jgi:hypothetical protein
MADYWIKLYHEIIDDPKMATLPDRLWRRVIELFLLAGKLCPDKSGVLPDTRQLAWLLRVSTDELQTDMSQLAGTGIIKSIPNGWMIVNFEKRQQAASSTERVKQHRERKQKQQYYDNETDLKRNVTQINRAETETETEQSIPIPLSPEITLYHKVTGLYPDVMRVEEVERNIRSAQQRKHLPIDEFTAHLRQVHLAWCQSKTGDGRPYNPANPKWLEWAITDYIPKPFTAPPPKMRKLQDAHGNIIEVPA